jgi:phage terminase large subunit
MKLEVTPVFTKNYHSQKKIVINRGGTRSSKTRSLAQISLLWLMTGQVTKDLFIPAGVWSTVRKFSTTLDSTVIRDFEEELDKQGYRGLVVQNKTKKTFTFSGRTIEFIGADDQQKLRGSKRSILYCNEANELGYREEFFQLLMRTEDKIFLDFNPDDENIWINTELEQKRLFDKGDVEVIVSTYKDNTFLPKGLVEEIEYLEKTDPEFWKVYGLGQYGKKYGLIFESVNVVESIPEGAKLIGYGHDFGFTNDPSTTLAVYKQDGQLFIDELLYERNLTNQDISDRWRALSITKQHDIIADSAEPKSIEELYRLGWNVYPATKGPDSIKNGIDIIKRYKLNATARSVNFLKETRSYKWAEDKDGQQLNKPIDYMNHTIDALRYLALNKLSESATGGYTVI